MFQKLPAGIFVEIFHGSVLATNRFMKKSIAMFLCLAIAGITLNAQSKKQKEPPAPPPKVETVKFEPPVIVKDDELSGFYNRHPSVSELKWKTQDKIIVTFKDSDKKNEEYNLADRQDEISFRKKYGDVPKAVPPPPPPPAKPKKAVQ